VADGDAEGEDGEGEGDVADAAVAASGRVTA
jgi:hypothetical protein